MFPLRMADAGIEAASDTAVEEPGVTLLQTTDERDSGGGAEEENDVSCFIEDFVQRKADTKLCFPWRPLSHFSCCPTKALMVLKIDIPVCIRLLSLIFRRNIKCESTSRLGRKVKFSVCKKKFDFLPSRGQVVTITSK